jgi:hypothetical protein
MRLFMAGLLGAEFDDLVRGQHIDPLPGLKLTIPSELPAKKKPGWFPGRA